MDIVFCVDFTRSMTIYFNKIHAMIILICTMILNMNGGVRIGLVKFRSAYDVWITRVHGFTRNINHFREWLDNDEPGGISPDGCEAVGDALNDALNIGWRKNTDNKQINERLVILITDGAPNGLFTPLNGADPWIISNIFKKEGIVLVVVGVGECVVECDDFFCALAKNTGGRYIPLVNFKRIFMYVMERVFNGNDTFRRVISHVRTEDFENNSSFKYSYMKDRVNGMINECGTMDDIRKLFFSRRSPYI